MRLITKHEHSVLVENSAVALDRLNHHRGGSNTLLGTLVVSFRNAFETL